jgi:hypothetical protein
MAEQCQRHHRGINVWHRNESGNNVLKASAIIENNVNNGENGIIMAAAWRNENVKMAASAAAAAAGVMNNLS